MAAKAGFRYLVSFVIICVFLWLLPFGAFIKPSQEKMACDGHRAFHMCSMMAQEIKLQPPGSKVSIASASGINSSAKSSAVGGDDFLEARYPEDVFLATAKYYGFLLNFSRTPLVRFIDHPPKTQILS